MTTVRLNQADPATANADALVVLVDRDGDTLRLRDDGQLPAVAADALLAAAVSLRDQLRPGTALAVPPGGAVAADVVVLSVLASDTDEDLRRAAGAGTRAVAGKGAVALVAPDRAAAAVAAVAQGGALGTYRFERFRSSADSGAQTTLTVFTPSARTKAVKEAVAEATLVADSVNTVRDLVNTPPNALTPDEFATVIRRSVADTAIRCEVLDERKLARGGYGGILGVGQGSTNPPRLVRLSYRPAKAKAHLALVGKGVTFDSGGLSLKPATAMVTMKCDMAGAAAVAEATLTAARLGLPVRITAYVALVENMPSGTAQRPGDVLTTYNGTTVEVLNTDAEGRLIMADALARACEDSPDLVVDVATLTGAQMVALGSRVSAAMANDDEARAQVLAAAEAAGEAFWPMPLPVELRSSLDSKIADIANIGERMGGMLVAGLFLQEFVTDGIPWVHLDIAGPAFNEGAAHGYTPAGGTGHAVRTLVELCRSLAGAG